MINDIILFISTWSLFGFLTWSLIIGLQITIEDSLNIDIINFSIDDAKVLLMYMLSGPLIIFGLIGYSWWYILRKLYLRITK